MAPLSDSDPRLDGSEPPTRIGISGNEDRTIVDFGPSEPTAITPVTFELPPPHDEIATEAYAIYEARGGTHGQHEDDWLEAERRVRTRRAGDTGKG